MTKPSQANSAQKPGLLFIGSMLGSHPGYTSPMGEIIANLLYRDGYPVIVSSKEINRIQRIFDILKTLVQSRTQAHIQVLQVYSGMSFILEDIASLVGKKCGYRIIMHLHGGGMPRFFKKHPRWAARVLRRADKIVVPSRFLLKALRQIGIDQSAIIIPNVIDLKQYPYRKRSLISPKFLWMRAFHPVYNPMMALNTFQIIQQKYPNSSMVMAGQDKGALEYLKQTASNLGLSDAICFPGFLDMKSKVSTFNCADVFLNTNDIDNAPVSVIEACACGVPIVATNVGGVPDLLEDGVNALLVDRNNHQEMANAALRLLKDPDLARSLSSNARILAEDCDWERVRKIWDCLFQEVMERSDVRH